MKFKKISDAMKTILIPIVFIILTSCTHSYSKIEAKNPTLLRATFQDYEITFRAPGGYNQENKLFQSKSVTGLLELHYDILSGPNVYGSPFGETRVYLRGLNTSFNGIKEYTLRRGEVSCEVHQRTEVYANCIGLKKCLTTHEGEIRDNWNLFIYHNEDDEFLSYTYAKTIGAGKFIEFAGVIEGPAYSRIKVRNERIRMIKDIFNTVSIDQSPQH